MTLGLREKLSVVIFALVALTGMAAGIFIPSMIASRLSAAMTDEWVTRAQLMALSASASSAPLSASGSWEDLARDLGQSARARVTIVGRDGVVLADSGSLTAEPEALDNQVDRVDFKAAIEAASPDHRPAGSALTYSRLPPAISVAVPFFRDRSVAGVLRVSGSLTPVDDIASDVRGMLWTGAIAALALGFVLSSVLARRVGTVVRDLTRAARRMSEGDLSVKTHFPGNDEFAELGHTLDRLAEGLATTFGELRGERDLQKKILEAMQEGVIVVDRDGRIALVNSALRAMLLLGADSVGKLLIETVRHAQLNAMIGRARGAPDERPVEIELPGLKPRRVLVQIAPLSAGDEGLLFVFVDVTELRRLESLRRDFVANASHELRTPIAAVRSATETLRSGALEDRAAASRFVDIIERNAQRLQSLVEDMLELSKLESNEFKLKRERVELQRVVPIVLALFRERADKKGVSLASEIPSSLPAVEGDPRALEHVLSNLVDNAVKYCPSGTRILVGAAADDQRVRLIVSDTGHGIAPEHLPRVFERFYRIDAGRSRELGGTGLGLSIVKHMVEAMRGKVSVESAIGKGSTFFVLLHRADAAGQSGNLPSQGASSRPRIAVGSDGSI